MDMGMGAEGDVYLVYSRGVVYAEGIALGYVDGKGGWAGTPQLFVNGWMAKGSNESRRDECAIVAFG